jgi:hypothetical protein
MRHYFAVLLLLLVTPAHAGDEFVMPTMRPSSGFESAEPKYRVVGIEDSATEHTLFVVAEPAVVLAQGSVNTIIRDARRRNPEITSINFYLSVRDKPAFPAFAIYDHIAVYVRKDNKTYFGVAAKSQYGGWTHGPTR